MQVVRAVDEAVHSGGKFVRLNTNLNTPAKHVSLDNLINAYIYIYIIKKQAFQFAFSLAFVSFTVGLNNS